MGIVRFETTGIIREPDNTNVPDIPSHEEFLSRLEARASALASMSVTDDEPESAPGDHSDFGNEAAELRHSLDIVRQGAMAPDYESACESFGLDPRHPVLSTGQLTVVLAVGDSESAQQLRIDA